MHMFDDLTDHDWLQIEAAASGRVSGNSDEWPHLVAAIRKCGNPVHYRKSASWLTGYCEALVAMRDRIVLEFGIPTGVIGSIASLDKKTEQ